MPLQAPPPRMIESRDGSARNPRKPTRVARNPATQTTPPTARSPKKSRQTTGLKQRVRPENTTPQRSGNYYASVYVAVYEHIGSPPTGCTKAMMRQSHIVVDHDPRENYYLVHEITEDPSIRGMKYRCSRVSDPRWARPTLLAMDLVVLIPAHQVVDLPSLFRGIRIQSHQSRAWNSQNFVREALHSLVDFGLMTDQQLLVALGMHRKAINLPVLSDMPNLLPSIFDLPENSKPTALKDQKESGS